MTKGSFFLLVAVILSFSLVSAELSVNIDKNNPSISLNHGQSESLTFTVTNNNFACSLSCDWNILKNNQEVVAKNTKSVSPGDPFSISYTFKAPTKSEAKQESGIIEYFLRVECSEVSTLFCGSDSDSATSTITLNYELTLAEKNAKAYLQPRLENIKNLLKETESKIFNLNSKLDELPSNVLISDIRTILSSQESSHDLQNSKYESLNSLYANLNFIEAKNAFDVNQESNLNTLNSALDQIFSDINERLRIHNEIVKKINDLSNSFAELEKKSELTRLDISDIINQIDSLVSSFEKGQFTSYTEISSKVDFLNNLISNKLKEINSNFGDIISKGDKLLSNERAKINVEGKVFHAGTETVDSLNTICEGFSQVKIKMDMKNQNLTLDYNDVVSEINEYNSQIDELNDKGRRLGSFVKNISTMINKNNIKDLDYSTCQEELEQINHLDYKGVLNLTESDYRNCIDLHTGLMEIKLEREKNLGFNFMSFLRSLWPFGGIKFKEIEEFSEKSLPDKPGLLSFDDSSQEFADQYCNINLNLNSKSLEEVTDVRGETLTNSNIEEVKENENLCSSFGITAKCCESNECSDDESSYPVIFLHGHSFLEGDSPEYSLDAFDEMQLTLFNEGFRIGGVFLPTDQKSNMVAGEWGKLKGIPISVKATYYYGVYNSEGDLISSPSKQESISTYAQRLGHIVELVKYRTGRNKVNIVAHSMGGLVAREYIKNGGGELSVNKLIMIGTPNHGIYNQGSSCKLLGANTECSQMNSGSDFLLNLNSVNEAYGNVEYYTIAGSGCVLSGEDGDGVVRVNSAKLDGAKNVLVKGGCEYIWGFPKAFHSNLLSTSKYPETYNYVRQFLKE